MCIPPSLRFGPAKRHRTTGSPPSHAGGGGLDFALLASALGRFRRTARVAMSGTRLKQDVTDFRVLTLVSRGRPAIRGALGRRPMGGMSLPLHAQSWAGKPCHPEAREPMPSQPGDWVLLSDGQESVMTFRSPRSQTRTSGREALFVGNLSASARRCGAIRPDLVLTTRAISPLSGESKESDLSAARGAARGDRPARALLPATRSRRSQDPPRMAGP